MATMVSRSQKRILAGDLGQLSHLEFDWRTGDGVGNNPYQAQPYFREMPRLIIHESLVHILDTFRFLNGELNVVECEIQ
jgi:predicted dehydrogenase